MTKRRHFVARRKAQGFSQEQLAETLGTDRSTIGRWEAGETRPQPWIRPRIARALNVSLDELDSLFAADSASFDVEDRANFIRKHPESVDLSTVGYLRDQVRQLDGRYSNEASTALLADTGQSLGQARFPSSRATSSRVRRELFTLESEAAILMGQLVWDASQRRDHDTSNLYLNQAVAVARALHDPATEGLALLRRTIVALYGEKDLVKALASAREATERTRNISNVLGGLSQLHAAEAHALLGARRACEAALVEAERCFEKIDTSDVAIDLFSLGQYGRMAGSCYLSLGDYSRSKLLLEDAAQEITRNSKSHAIVLGNLTLVAIRQGNVSDATARLHQAIDVIEINRSGGGLNVVAGASRELNSWRSAPPVQEVQDRLLTLFMASN